MKGGEAAGFPEAAHCTLVGCSAEDRGQPVGRRGETRDFRTARVL
jgi:hypothetical protein